MLSQTAWQGADAPQALRAGTQSRRIPLEEDPLLLVRSRIKRRTKRTC